LWITIRSKIVHPRENSCHSWSELITENGEIGSRSRHTSRSAWAIRPGPWNEYQKKRTLPQAERNEFVSQDNVWAFVCSFRTCTNLQPESTVPMHPHPNRSLSGYFSISVQFFSQRGPPFFGQHDSPSNLAESRYPQRCILSLYLFRESRLECVCCFVLLRGTWTLRKINPEGSRVPGLPIRNCADIFNNLLQWGAEVSAIDVTGNIIFERLYLVSDLRNIALIVTMHSAPTSPPLALQLFLDFRAIFSPCGLSIFCSAIRQVIWPSPGTLEGSCPDRSVLFLFYSSTRKNPTVSSYLVHFANWMKCVQKCQKIARC